jgi:hypothetical protein
MGLIIPSVVSVLAIGLYIVAFWIGRYRIISTIFDASNFAMALMVVATGLASAVGLPLSANLLYNPGVVLRAIGRLYEQF